MRDFFQTLINGIKRAWYRLVNSISKKDYGAQAQNDRHTGDTRLFSKGKARDIYGYEHEGPRENEHMFVEKERRRPFILSVLFTTLRVAIICIVFAGFALLGGGIGVAKAYIDTAPELDQAQLTKSDRTSFLYDKDGVLITSIADVEYRDWVSLDEIPELLQNAFISVEDIRFYKHSGVDMKRLFSAALEVLGNANASGGSTITQQLVKNKILDPAERTYRRKIQEAYLALTLEKEINKDQILEAYLNDIHLGEANYGVKTAAKDYFGKELNQLTARECALLAGLTQNPYYYNPRLNKYKRDPGRWVETMKRTDKVLSNMYSAGYIDVEQYNEALKEDVYILEVSEQRQLYDMPYFVEYAIRDVITHLLTQRGLTEADYKTVENELRTSGYHIYTTVDSEMQHLVQDTLSAWEKYPPLHNPNQDTKTEKLGNGEVLLTVEPQASAVVFDYHTGELRVIVGGRNTPIIRKGLNRAYQSYMEVGSSIKPLSVYGPAFDLGASPATIIGNFKAPLEGWTKSPGYPYIGNEKWIGPLSIRQGIVSSLNVMAARTLVERVGMETGAQYLINMGANPAQINADGSGLALGTSGLTTIQMAGAFGAIANLGQYQEPLSFTKVVDSQGNIILDANAIRVKRQVYQQSTAYMLVDVLTDAVNRGTGTSAKIKGMTVAGKTGTNSDYRSVYFAGMTPYYSAAVWIGHDNPSASFLKKGSTGGDYGAPLWQAFMSKIHEGLPDKTIIDASPASLGLVKKTVCSVSGLLPTDACYADQSGHVPITDWFLDSNAPIITCDMHAAVAICSESGMVAEDACPETSVVSGSVVLINPGNYYDQFTDEQLYEGLKNFVRTTVPIESYVEALVGYSQRCTVHGGYLHAGEDNGVNGTDADEYTIQELRMIAYNLRNDIQIYIRNNSLEQEYSAKLLRHIGDLDALRNSYNKNMLFDAIARAQADFNAAKAAGEGGA